jgi:hypothetical protein
MPRSVTLTTPIPTLEELRTRLGVSKSRMRELLQIMEGDERPASRGNGANGRSTGAGREGQPLPKKGQQSRKNTGRTRKNARAASSR